MGVPSLMNSDMPNYFSATNCRASGEVLVWGNVPGTSTARHLVRAELWVGGELVREWDRNPGDNNIQNLSLAVMFDSTHFEHGTWVEVRFKAWDQTGQLYQDADESYVWNWAEVWGRYDLEGLRRR